MPLNKDTGTCGPEDIEKLAYQIYLERLRKNEPGTALEDWLKAERELNVEVELGRAFGLTERVVWEAYSRNDCPHCTRRGALKRETEDPVAGQADIRVR